MEESLKPVRVPYRLYRLSLACIALGVLAEGDPESWTPDYVGGRGGSSSSWVVRTSIRGQFRRDALEVVKKSGRPIAEVAGSLRVVRAPCGTTRYPDYGGGSAAGDGWVS